MANYPGADARTRFHWGGTDADRDIHVEKYDGKILASFATSSLFRSAGLSDEVDVAHQSNTYRFDYLGGAVTNTRQSGEELEALRAVNEKAVITVDRTTYVRHFVDWLDDWTAPNVVDRISREQGRAHAKTFDLLHITQLLKAGRWEAPQSLKDSGNFYDGLWYVMDGISAAETEEEQAEIFVSYFKKAITAMTNRDLDTTNNFVALLTPELFAILVEHKKLFNILYGGGDPVNNYAGYRVAELQGVRVIQTPRFPKIPGNQGKQGANFNLTAEDVRAQAVLFHPEYTLSTVWAHDFTTMLIPNPENHRDFIDSFGAYTVGLYRGDACAVFAWDADL